MAFYGTGGYLLEIYASVFLANSLSKSSSVLVPPVSGYDAISTGRVLLISLPVVSNSFSLTRSVNRRVATSAPCLGVSGNRTARQVSSIQVA